MTIVLMRLGPGISQFTVPGSYRLENAKEGCVKGRTHEDSKSLRQLGVQPVGAAASRY